MTKKSVIKGPIPFLKNGTWWIDDVDIGVREFKLKRKCAKKNPRYEWTEPTIFEKEGEDHYEEFKNFKKKHGFSPEECWNLDNSIAKFVLPRLLYYRKHYTSCHPVNLTVAAWRRILDKMVWSFRIIADADNDYYSCPKNYAGAEAAYCRRLQNGITLFGKYFLSLWS